MGLFGRLFGRRPPQVSPGEAAFDALCDEHLGIAQERQRRLADHIAAEPTWSFDPDTWVLQLGAKVFEVAPLGAFDPKLGWVWAWHYRPPHVTDAMVHEALGLRAEGERRGIPGFLAPTLQMSLEIGRDLAHKAGCIASGMFGFPYYLTNHPDGGSMVLMVRDAELGALPPPDFDTTQSTLLTALRSELWSDLGRMAQAYLVARGYAVTNTAGNLRATHPTGGVVRVEFEGKRVQVNSSNDPTY